MSGHLKQNLARFLHDCDHQHSGPMSEHHRAVYDHKAELVLTWFLAHGAWNTPSDE